MNGLSDLSDIERLKLIKSICLSCTSEDEIDEIIRNNAEGIEDAKRRVKGLLLEDEFLLLCSLMGTCHSVNGLEQGLAINNNLKVPDFAVVFNLENCIYDSQKTLKKLPCFVEVKTSDGFETSDISKGFYNKYVKYANLFDLPLFVASRLQINDRQQYWIIQSSKQFSERSRRASVENLCNSMNHILLNDFFISPTQDVMVTMVFTKKPIDSSAFHKGLGYLYSVEIQGENGRLELSKQQLGYTLFLDSFAQVEVSRKIIGDEIHITRKIDYKQSQLLSDMLLRANFHVLETSGAEYTSAGRLLALVESGSKILVYRQHFEKLINFFNSNEPLFYASAIGSEEDNKSLIKNLQNSKSSF